MGTDFEVISKDCWCLLVKYFSERLNQGDEDSEAVQPVVLVRSYELLGLGIRTQIEYFMQQVSRFALLCHYSGKFKYYRFHEVE